jgi:hypothetical protein
MREKLRRVALWALLGAASGAVAFVAVLTAESTVLVVHVPKILFLLPGLSFGAVVGLALRRVGLARGWQVVLFAAFSVAAWHAGYIVGVEYGFLLAANLFPERYSMEFVGAGLVGGLVWGVVQTLGAAVLFSFARRRRLCVILPLVGSATATLIVVPYDQFVDYSFFPGPELYFILWTGWYAVYAAVLSVFLPWPKSEA